MSADRPDDARDDWLPPDQIATRKFPVVGERSPLPQALDLTRWHLEVIGGMHGTSKMAWHDYQSLPHRDLTMDIHCVTRWSRQRTTFTGVPLQLLLDRVGVGPEITSVRFVAWSARDHDTSLPLAEALDRTWVVHAADGAPLSTEHGGPVRTVTVGRYFYKSLKWLRRIELSTEHRLGFWERTDGYHDTADPWPGDQRYVGGSLRPAELTDLRVGKRLSRWRRQTVRSADLRGWAPPTRSIGAVKLKNCDLRGAQLAGADLTGANLTLSDLRGADLRGATLVGADLEGCQLAGADLRGADLTGAFLTAASLFASDAEAQIDGACFDDASGLLEEQQAWLERAKNTTG